MSAKQASSPIPKKEKLTKDELVALANFLFKRFEKQQLQIKQHKRNN
jgi:hypothetical protein